MKIFRFLLRKRKKTARRAALAVVLFVVLLATAALGDEIDGSLPPDSSQAVKASARQAIQSGLEQESVVKLTQAMLQNNFDQQQIQQTHALMVEAQNSDMPVQPLMNKAFEGMAKGVDPSLILRAMQTVQSRHAFAYQQAARLSRSKSQTANLGRALSAALAAGFSKEDDRTLARLPQSVPTDREGYGRYHCRDNTGSRKRRQL